MSIIGFMITAAVLMHKSAVFQGNDPKVVVGNSKNLAAVYV